MNSLTLNKSELTQIFPAISSSAIQERDGEYVIVGKFCIIAPLGENCWDVWLCNPKDLPRGLTTRKLHSLLKNLPQEAAFTVLDGEAYAQVQGTELIEKNLDLMGVKKRRKLSEERRRALVEQAKKMNQGRK